MVIIKNNTIPYLDERILNSYNNVTLLSTEGPQIKMNSLILCALSHTLKMTFHEDDDDHTIITEFSLEELKQVKEFCMRGSCNAMSEPILEAFGLLKIGEIKLSDNPINKIKTEHYNATLSNSKSVMNNSLDNTMINSQILVKNEFVDIKEEPIDNVIEFDHNLEYSSDDPLKTKNNKKKKMTKKLEYDGDWEPGTPSKIKTNKANIKLTQGVKKCQVCDLCKKSCNNLPKHMNNFHDGKLSQEDKKLKLTIRSKQFSDEDLALFQSFELPKKLEEYVTQPRNLLGLTNKMEENVKDKTKPLECPQCHLRFSGTSGSYILKTHMIKHHNEHLQCQYCEVAFCLEDSEKFMKHMFLHLKKSFKSCIQCGYFGTRQIMLREHLERRGPLHNDECSQCSKKMPSYQAYQDHVKEEHYNIWKYKCGILDCGEIFNTEEESKKHFRSGHTQKNRGRKKNIPKPQLGTVCHLCGITFKKISAHMMTKHGDPVLCTHCGRKCATAYNLKMHIKKVHLKVQCPTCGNMVNDLYSHNRTKHIPESERPFGCDTCGKRFWDQSKLEEHYNVHTGAKPFKCKYCSTGFGSFGSMRMHEKGHLGIKRKPKKS